MTLGAKEHFEAGRLQEAIEAMNAEVKSHPTDANRRGFLAELLCFAGRFERADLQLDVLTDQDPKAAIGIALFRQLVRAELARRQFYSEGRLPEFLGQPSPLLQLHLQASIRLRENDAGDAAKLLAQAEDQRPAVGGICDGRAFEDMRDLDDLTAPFFEVLTSTGKYYWIPMDRVVSLEFRPPERPRDLIWRRAQMTVAEGPDGEVFLPAIYAGTDDQEDRALLGRVTDWAGGEGAPVRGIGQRGFLIGNESKTIMEISTIEFGEAAA
ncbi:type VI secretion system accessory protein TagJ [Rhodospirillaceae bacterium SYSU D60014]|uniref:type VI secretion system accessory protein TagJ n=1 Tax=Virgifigura deserti TaxID=2268457 RepID=UPI000E661BE2